jgi:CheY-like chemotaxis protein
MAEPDPAGTTEAPSQALILVVEDEPQLLMLTQLQLQAAGFATARAADGNEALRAMELGMPDLVLLDLMMPFLDGWAVMEEVQQWERRPPIVVTSALGLNAQRQRAMGMGASGFLVKPYPVERLFEEIRKALGDGADPKLPTLGAPDVWGDATNGYHVRVESGPAAGVWQITFEEGAWDQSTGGFEVPPRWVLRGPNGDRHAMDAVPQQGVRALEDWMARITTPETAVAFLAYCAPSQDRLGQVVPRRHLAV